MFFKLGIRNVTMDEIARHLQISKKTIYCEFSDKDALVDAMVFEDIEKHRKAFDKIFNHSANVVDEVFQIMQKMTEIFSNCNPILYHDLKKFYPECWTKFHEFRHNFILGKVERSIEKGKKDGLVREGLNNKILALLRMEEINMGISGEVFPTDKFNLLEVQLALAEHFLYGICTLKGHKMVNRFKEISDDE